MMPTELSELLGDVDIYWLDQILRGRVPGGSRVLDVGCGGGRNLHYLAQISGGGGYDLHGIDSRAAAIEQIRSHFQRLGVDPSHFQVGDAAQLDHPDSSFDITICNAVLHFAEDAAHFGAMTRELERVLRPGGMAFCRLATLIPGGVAIEERPGWFRLPDGSDRFLVSVEELIRCSDALGVSLLDPVKTVNVQDLRCMTTWVWQKSL